MSSRAEAGVADARPATIPSERPMLLGLGLCVVAALWVATNYVAYRARALGDGALLGPWALAAPTASLPMWRVAAAVCALTAVAVAVLARRSRWGLPAAAIALVSAVAAFIVASGPVYGPLSGLAWAARYGTAAGGASPAAVTPSAVAGARVGALALGDGVWAFGAALSVAVSLLFALRPRRIARPPSSAFGSAVWGTGEALRGTAGFAVGRAIHGASSGARRSSWRRRPTSPSDLLRYAGDGHLLTIAPTRSGKGVGCVLPNLLTYRGAVLVTDPKGENFAVTARARRALGQQVIAIDPFGVVGGLDAFNPLDAIDPTGEDANDEARLLADMLVVEEGRGGGDHTFWTEEARALLSGLILHVVASAPPELRTLSHVRELLTLPPEPFQLVLTDMLESEDVGGLVSRAAARLLQKAERERSGVISAAQSHTHFLDSPRMGRVLGRSSFRMADLRGGALSLYLVLPPERLDGYRRWLRLVIASALLELTRRAGMSGSASVGQPRHRVLFMLDEFAHLGRMQPIERDVGLVAGYGVTFWLLLQDMAQLRATYGDRWQTFVANCAVLQAFGTNDWETAEYLSKLTGEATIRIGSENVSTGVSRGRHAQRQHGSSNTTSERGRRLLTPDEVLRLPRDEQLVFVRGEHPVRAKKLAYHRDEEFRGLADPNPLHDTLATVPPERGTAPPSISHSCALLEPVSPSETTA